MNTTDSSVAPIQTSQCESESLFTPWGIILAKPECATEMEALWRLVMLAECVSDVPN